MRQPRLIDDPHGLVPLRPDGSHRNAIHTHRASRFPADDSTDFAV
jgi:hypothetical protein